jgi:hypothetical protein
MYKIIGADQREYGPVSADQIRQWVREGRVNATTLIQVEGSPGWRALSSYPEFGVPPPVAPIPPAYPTTSQTNGNAIAGLVLGLLSFTCPCAGFLVAALGIVFSCIALSQLASNPAQKGKGLAIAGLVLSICGLLIWLGFGFISLLPHRAAHYYRHWNF